MEKIEPRPDHAMIMNVHDVLQLNGRGTEGTFRNEKGPVVAGGALVKIVASEI